MAAEFAFVKLRDTQLDALIVGGHRRARLARHILQNLTSYLSATQLGITMASLGLGWLSEPVFHRLAPALAGLVRRRFAAGAGSIAFAVGFSVVTFLQIVLGELGPKWFAIQRALPVSCGSPRPCIGFTALFYPFNWILNRSAQWLLRRVGIEAGSGAPFVHSEEELRLMLAQRRAGCTPPGPRHHPQRPGSGPPHRPQRHASAHGNRRLDTEATLAECLELAEKTRYSRFPLCQGGDLDKTLGVVHFKDLFALRAKAGAGRTCAAWRAN